jgi:CheY-like chemotaxis protein
MDKYRILVIDDTVDILRTIQLLLEERYEIVLAKDGVMGYQKAVTYLPDLLIMDIMMPKMSGYQLFDMIKKHPAIKEVPIIFISAKGTPLDQQYGLKKGAAAYLPKPFEPKLLFKMIEDLLNANPPTPKVRPDYMQVMLQEELRVFVRQH